MEERLTLHYLYVGLLAVIVTILLALFPIHSIAISQNEANLSDQAICYERIFEKSTTDSFQNYLAISESNSVWYASDGSLLYLGQSPQLEAYDFNYLCQQIISGETQWTDKGTSQSYQLIEFTDGSKLLLSAPSPSLSSVLNGKYGYILVIILIALPVCFMVSFFMAKRDIAPITSLCARVSDLSFNKKAKIPYPELAPLVKEITERQDEREAMRQEFTANVSHELKTPLTTISGYSEMIATGIVRPEDICTVAEKIHSEAERMQSLVKDIIELNALASESATEHTDMVDMLSIVQDCVEQLIPVIQAKHISLSVSGNGFSILGNKRQLWELTYNLIDNAQRYNIEHGRIQITIESNVLSVKDNGMGIPKEHQPRIFERFYRVDKSHSRASGGTGLGLSIVKHVAELHNATIELESTEHIGTEIRVIFPQ